MALCFEPDGQTLSLAGNDTILSFILLSNTVPQFLLLTLSEHSDGHALWVWPIRGWLPLRTGKSKPSLGFSAGDPHLS